MLTANTTGGAFIGKGKSENSARKKQLRQEFVPKSLYYYLVVHCIFVQRLLLQ